jgi:hypothetical protein
VVEFVSAVGGGLESGEGAPSLTDLQIFANLSNIPFKVCSFFYPLFFAYSLARTCRRSLVRGSKTIRISTLGNLLWTFKCFQQLHQLRFLVRALFGGFVSSLSSDISVNVTWVFGMAVELFNLPSTPAVVSVSYGTDEKQQCSGVGNCT